MPARSLPFALFVGLGLGVLGACTSSNMAGPPYPVVVPTSKHADVGAPGEDPMQNVRSRGTMHGQPIVISASGGRPERSIVFLGTPEAARAAWVVTPGAAVRAAVPVEGWPSGVKVVSHVVRGQLVHLIVETQPTLDQPQAVQSVVVVDANYASMQTLDESWRFIGSKDNDEIVKRLNAPPPARVLRGADMVTAMKDASKNAVALGKSFRTDGAQLYTVWQSVVAQPIEHLDTKNIGKSTHLKRMFEILRSAAVQERCEASICWAVGEKGQIIGGVALGQDGGSTVIDGFVEHAPAAMPKIVGGTAAVASASGTGEAILREQRVQTPKRILGEASIGGGKEGGVVVAESTDDDHHLVIGVRDGNFSRVYDEKTTNQNGILPREVRFADLDGDGRTDVIIRAAGKWDRDGSAVTFHRALLAPTSVQLTTLASDPAAEYAMLGAATIDDAVKAALNVMPKALTPAAACALIARARTVDAFKSVATQEAKVLTFDEPGSPTLHGTVKAMANLRAADVRDVGKKCREMKCDPTRPVCLYTDAPYTEYYFFGWNDAKVLRVQGAAFYNGP